MKRLFLFLCSDDYKSVSGFLVDPLMRGQIFVKHFTAGSRDYPRFAYLRDFVHAHAESDIGVKIMEPLYLHNSDHTYTEQLKEFLTNSLNVAYVTKNSAPREAYLKKLL